MDQNKINIRKVISLINFLLLVVAQGQLFRVFFKYTSSVFDFLFYSFCRHTPIRRLLTMRLHGKFQYTIKSQSSQFILSSLSSAFLKLYNIVN